MQNDGYQLDLFDVEEAYSRANRPLSNKELYASVAEIAGIPMSALEEISEIGRSREKCSKLKRQIRWFQQTLKGMNMLKRVEGERGIWQLASKTKKGLHEPKSGVSLVAYSTKLGLSVWTDSRQFLSDFSEPIHLCVTSPPYPLRQQRGYGNVDEAQWVDFICHALEPIVKNLVAGGSIVLNISNDIFETKSPARSLYAERMVLALHDRLSLHLMDRWPWINLSKPPGPTIWSCVNRVQLCAGWEPIYWFTNDPHSVRSDNRRVLLPHTDEHRQLVESGGDKRVASYGDGAYQLRGKSFSTRTEGRIPKNVIIRGHRCADTLAARKAALDLGLPPHSAMFPTTIPEQAILFLTQEGDLVVDPFAGSNKTGLAAERNNRRWVACEKVLEFIRSQAELFVGFPGYEMNQALATVGTRSGQ